VDPKKEAEEAEKARYEAKRAQMRKAQAEHDEILAKFQKQAHESDLQEQEKQQEQLQKQGAGHLRGPPLLSLFKHFTGGTTKR